MVVRWFARDPGRRCALPWAGLWGPFRAISYYKNASQRCVLALARMIHEPQIVAVFVQSEAVELTGCEGGANQHPVDLHRLSFFIKDGLATH